MEIASALETEELVVDFVRILYRTEVRRTSAWQKKQGGEKGMVDVWNTYCVLIKGRRAQAEHTL